MKLVYDLALKGEGTKFQCSSSSVDKNSLLHFIHRYIVDTRSVNQTISAKARGGGTEMDTAYPQWRKVHKPIPRPHDLADSFFKLVEACSDVNSSTSQWLSRLDNSGWLSAVQSALDAACVTAQCLHQEVAAVLVHGMCTLRLRSLRTLSS